MTESILLSTDYTLVIDTDSYSPNFSKKLCAYCTGFVDEENEGLDCSDLFYLDLQIEDDDSPKGRVAEQKNPFYGYVAQRQDENGVYSPCCVWLNKRYGYNERGEYALLTEDNFSEYDYPAPLSVGIFFDEEPTEEQVQIIKDRTVKFFADVWPKLGESTQSVKMESLRLISHKKYGEEQYLVSTIINHN